MRTKCNALLKTSSRGESCSGICIHATTVQCNIPQEDEKIEQPSPWTTQISSV